MDIKNGRLIVLEGGDGAGKSSVIQHLKNSLPPENFWYTREPGGNITAEKIRGVILDTTSKEASPHTMLMLFWAARVEHLTNVIIPRLATGQHVVSDRFDASTFGYQIYGEEHYGLISRFSEMRKWYVNRKPHYIFLDVDPTEGRRRALVSRQAVSNHYDERPIDYYERVREGFEAFRKIFKPEHTLIDANQPLEQVCAEVLAKVKSLTGF